MELRWLVREGFHVLQFRIKTQKLNYDEWGVSWYETVYTDWKDVPITDESNN